LRWQRLRASTAPAARLRAERPTHVWALGFQFDTTALPGAAAQLQRTHYRPGALCQFDLWQPSPEIRVGCGQTRRGYVVVSCLPYSRVGAGTLVWDREAAAGAEADELVLIFDAALAVRS